jgi:hypothetical protein
VETSVYFDVHGLSIAVSGDWPEILEALRLDFAWFHAAPGGSPDVEVAIERRAPDFDVFGDVPASFVTPRNVVFQQDDRTIVDYFGRAVSVLDRGTGRLRVQGDDAALVHEAAYHYLVSRLGEYFDAVGKPRLHALGLVGREGAVAIMLPSGGGKSTLALRALREDGVKLLSEDSPLIDARGRLHPFPLRIGINATDAATLPEGQVRRIERMEFHPKYALELEAFAERIEAAPQPLRHLVVGRRTLGRNAKLEPLPRRSAFGTLFREAVVGVGLYQGMEFVLQRGARDVAGMAGIATTRSLHCLSGLARASTWRLTIGRDHERNWEALQPLLR